MQSENFARLYNEGDLKPLYASLFDKQRQISATGRGLPGMASFHIELGDDREIDRNRLVLFDSSDRDQNWAETRRSTDIVVSHVVTGEEGVYNGIRSEVSDNSDEFEEDLDLEARCLEKPPELAQQTQVDELVRMNPDRDDAEGVKVGSLAAQKFVFPFLNPFSTTESHPVGNGIRREDALPDPLYFQTTSRARETFIERQVLPEHSLRHFLSDPVSGALMEDAFILPCGDSVGGAGYQRVQETNVCVVCFRQVSVMSAAPNHALRTAVLAYKRERECGSIRPAKRRRDQDHDRPKGVQFPYNVSDRVLIKGNKRTPERFVGREAIITTQCLNGWYLVKTLDNGESVRLQYRSLEKL